MEVSNFVRAFIYIKIMALCVYPSSRVWYIVHSVFLSLPANIVVYSRLCLSTCVSNHLPTNFVTALMCSCSHAFLDENCKDANQELSHNSWKGSSIDYNSATKR